MKGGTSTMEGWVDVGNTVSLRVNSCGGLIKHVSQGRAKSETKDYGHIYCNGSSPILVSSMSLSIDSRECP